MLTQPIKTDTWCWRPSSSSGISLPGKTLPSSVTCLTPRLTTGCIFHADLENGFAVAVRHLVTCPTRPGKVADKPAKLRSCVWSHV